LPIVYFDPKVKAVGLAHAGWRGVVGKLPALMVVEMMRQYGSQPENIMVGIGPSLSREANIVKDAVQLSLPEWKDFIHPLSSHEYQLDLIGFTVHQLAAVGVPLNNIEDGGVCTALQADDFYSWSARQESQRMGTVVGL